MRFLDQAILTPLIHELRSFRQVTTLGQPLEVVKTQMASNRQQTMMQALRTVWSRGGVLGFYQGLIPWAWIEASTKGAVLLFTAAEIEKVAKGSGIGPGAAGLLGGMGGGIAQAYATMGTYHALSSFSASENDIDPHRFTFSSVLQVSALA